MAEVEAPEIEDVDTVHPQLATAMHGLFDSQGASPKAGDRLPLLWHWLAFFPRPAQKELGLDGHPSRTSSTFPERYSQRMFAGARLKFPGLAEIGKPMTMSARVISSEEKVGKSGALLLVTWERTFESSGETVIVEEQDIVYRGASKALHEDGTVIEQSEELQWPWSENMKIEPTLLFRFSALTYNAHRIHYDRDYARGVEGYPGLVVHGPLQAMALAEMLRHRLPDMSVSSFEFRSVRPVFDGTTLRLRAKPLGNEVQMAVLDVQGRIAMRASAKLEG